MTKKTKINSSRRNFLAGSATVAGAAAAASVMPISIANANHTDAGAKGLPSWTNWKKRSAL
ncbi:MAG: twin-arginine translocation signal domain-containing protein, partial [Pelagibacteraceae bacterium]